MEATRIVHEPPNAKFEFTPTWIVAVVSSIIVLISFSLERGLHRLGKWLKHKEQDELHHAVLKLKEELMILGFISLLLNVFQGAIGSFCMPKDFANHMLPCKRSASVVNHFSSPTNFIGDSNIHRHLLSSQVNFQHCSRKNKVPLLSLEALHQLHIFIFVLAVVHVIFCATTMLLASLKIRLWKKWEDHILKELPRSQDEKVKSSSRNEFENRAKGYWRRAAVIGWMMAFMKQFHGSITKSDYTSLRRGFIQKHCPGKPNFNFYDYITKTYKHDFKKVVGISWYLWVFVVLFLLLNLEGWHTYFWMSFLPLIMLLLVGAKLEYIITRMAQELNSRIEDKEAQHEIPMRQQRKEKKHQQQQHCTSSSSSGGHVVKPSDEHFWFGTPSFVLFLIHFILFQNSFEIAFFFWIWTTYGFRSCIMEQPAFVITRLFLGAIVQVLCSYSTLPLYSLVTQMGSEYKEVENNEQTEEDEEVSELPQNQRSQAAS